MKDTAHDPELTSLEVEKIFVYAILPRNILVSNPEIVEDKEKKISV